MDIENKSKPLFAYVRLTKEKRLVFDRALRFLLPAIVAIWLACEHLKDDEKKRSDWEKEKISYERKINQRDSIIFDFAYKYIDEVNKRARERDSIASDNIKFTKELKTLK